MGASGLASCWCTGVVLTEHDSHEVVLSAIERLVSSRSKRLHLVGIDGFGGSGKSTLARALDSHEAVSAVVEGDDFYGPERPGWEGLSPREGYEHFFDHDRLARQVLEPLGRGADCRYQRYDWGTNRLGDWVALRGGGVVVVEGVYMLRPQLRGFWDLSVFVDTPWPIRLDRQTARGENSDEDIRRWTDAEKYYERTVDPAALADIVVPGHAYPAGD